MRILVVEDDHLQAEWLRTNLGEGFPELRESPKIELMSTEFEFRQRFGEITDSPPDVIVMDVMLRWADPSPDMEPPPPDVVKEGFYVAGLRCEQLLAADRRTRVVPVILYTVLDSSALNHELRKLRPNVRFLPKESDIKPLVRMINFLTTAR